MEKEPQPSSREHGESHGGWKKKVILDEVHQRAQDGLPIDEILPLLQTAMHRHEIEGGGDPQKVSGALDNDDVSFTLLELQRTGNVRIDGGRVYPMEG